MIYINENGTYCKYFTSYDDKLICSDAKGDETSVLGNVSGEFDALCADDGSIHFILQGTGGELIYLLKENNTWKKYNIFKSRRGIKKINNIRLFKQGKYLCAFYIMEHGGKKLMVKHRFCKENLYEEPVVLGVAHSKGNYCICRNGTTFVLIYKSENSTWIKVNMEKEFTKSESRIINFDEDIISIKTLSVNGRIYACALVPKNSSAVLTFFDTDAMNSAKIISFGLARNCVPEIICYNERLYIQWEENASVIEVYSDDFGKSFSKPARTRNACELASVRQAENINLSDRCAIYNFAPCLKKDNLSKRSASAINNFNSNYTTDSSILLEKLKSIETDIDNMGKKLIEMCSYLEVLKKLSHNEPEESFEACIQNSEPVHENDVGEINTENMKLFENTDIDSVLPESNTREVN